MTVPNDPASLPDTVPAGWEPVEDEGFIDLVGPVFLRPSDGAYAFRAAQKHANLIGLVHGGMLMSVADRALGVAAMRAADGANCLTIELGIQFVGAGRLGDWIEARPEVVRRTNSLVFLRGEVTTGGAIIATASGIWKILRRRPAGAVPVSGGAGDPI